MKKEKGWKRKILHKKPGKNSFVGYKLKTFRIPLRVYVKSKLILNEGAGWAGGIIKIHNI